MPYIGKSPANVPVTAEDIPNNSITSAKILDNVITADDVGANAIGLSELNATGTASNTTFLRGDLVWSNPTQNFPFYKANGNLDNIVIISGQFPFFKANGSQDNIGVS